VDGYSMDVLKKGNHGFLRLCAAFGCHMGMKPLVEGNWYHVAVVFLSGRAAHASSENWSGVKFFVNGENDHTADYPPVLSGIQSTQENERPLRIGRAGEGDSHFRGYMDDVSIWNICLDQERIRKLMFERLGGNEPGLIGYWGFNEGGGTTVADSSKRKRHGNIVGPVNWVPSEEKEFILNNCS
jgi:hypothetical protein